MFRIQKLRPTATLKILNYVSILRLIVKWIHVSADRTQSSFYIYPKRTVVWSELSAFCRMLKFNEEHCVWRRCNLYYLCQDQVLNNSVTNYKLCEHGEGEGREIGFYLCGGGGVVLVGFECYQE